MNKTALITKYLKAPVIVKDDFILSKCKGKKVLDVGCVGQNKFFTSPLWVHGKIKKAAAELTGVDINTEATKELTELGYLVLTPEQLTTSNETFDVIVMGDVIEHVDNIVEFLNFYKKFLKEKGELIITTPNAFNIRQSIAILLYGKPGINDEHTSTLDCYTMLELLKRCDLSPKDFYWLHEYSKAKKISTKTIYFLARTMYTIRRYYSPYFVFTACQKK